jgi:hypothetical protein
MWHVAHNEDRRNAYKIQVGTPDRLNMWDDNIKTDFRETGL